MMGRVENNKTTLVAGGHEIRVFEGIYPCHPTASRGPNAEKVLRECLVKWWRPLTWGLSAVVVQRGRGASDLHCRLHEGGSATACGEFY